MVVEAEGKEVAVEAALTAAVERVADVEAVAARTPEEETAAVERKACQTAGERTEKQVCCDSLYLEDRVDPGEDPRAREA